MSMDKAIQHGKEYRKPYHGAKAVDSTCRNHGSCPYCEGNRMYHNKKELERTDSEMREMEETYEKTACDSD